MPTAARSEPARGCRFLLEDGTIPGDDLPGATSAWTTSDGTTTETRIVPGLRGGDRLINDARQPAVSWGIANDSKVVTFAVEDLAGKPVSDGTVVVPPAG